MNSNSWQPTDSQLPNRSILRALAEAIRPLPGSTASERGEPAWRRLGSLQMSELLTPEPPPAPQETTPAPAASRRRRRDRRNRRQLQQPSIRGRRDATSTLRGLWTSRSHGFTGGSRHRPVPAALRETIRS